MLSLQGITFDSHSFLQRSFLVSNREAPINVRCATSTIQKQLSRNRRSVARTLFRATGIKRLTAFLETESHAVHFSGAETTTTKWYICVTRDPRWDRELHGSSQKGSNHRPSIATINNSVLRGEFAQLIAKCLRGQQPRPNCLRRDYETVGSRI